MADAPAWKRTIVYHAPLDAFGSKTDVILTRLGYRMLSPGAFEALRETHPSLAPDMLLVDERRLSDAMIQDEDASRVPIVLLTGRQGATGADPRIVGAVKRPAGLHDLYRLMQQVFEDTPRSTPRIATQLRARCVQGDRDWCGRVLSLSENGCLIRSAEAIPLGQRLCLEFSLPQTGSLRLEAEAAYQLLPDVGLVFNALAPTERETLEHFVTQTILSA